MTSSRSRMAVPPLAGLAVAAVLSGLATLKLDIPPNTQWLAVCLALVPGAAVGAGWKSIVQNAPKLRIYVPWIIFLLTIAFAAWWNGLGFSEAYLSVATIAKFLLMAVVLAMLVALRPTIADLHFVLMMTLIVAALGLAISLFYPDWIVRLGGGRLGWTWARAGVLWRIGIFVLPFLIWRAMGGAALATFPSLVLAASIMALDGSRTGLLAAGGLWLGMAALAFFLPRRIQAVVGLGTTLLAVVMGYVIIQPRILHLFDSGQLGRVTSGVAILLMVAWVLLSGHTHRVWSRGLAISALFVVLLVGTLTLPQWVENRFQSVSQTTDQTEVRPRRAPRDQSSPVALERLGGGDDVRWEMIQQGLRGTVENFPFGGGLGTTVWNDRGTEMHIHMTYLQLVSDVGALGLLSYLGIFSVFLWAAAKQLRDGQLAVAAPLAVVLLSLLNGFFVPLSNEISDWFPVLIAFAVIYAMPSERLRD